MMNCIYTAVIVAPFFAASPSEGTAPWATGFPIAVPKAGLGLVLGSARAEHGYSLGSATVRYTEKNGGVLRTAKAVLHPDGSFFTIISGLAPGASYHVTVEFVQDGPGKKRVLSTGVATITAR